MSVTERSLQKGQRNSEVSRLGISALLTVFIVSECLLKAAYNSIQELYAPVSTIAYCQEVHTERDLNSSAACVKFGLGTMSAP